MWRLALLLAAMAVAVPAEAQEPASASAPAGSSSAAAEPAGGGSLPVSLDRIREGLQKPPDSNLKNVEVQADFTVHIEDQRRIDEILSKLDFTTGPVPAGGLRAYEQQRQLFNPVDRPLQQPYAAFSGGEMFTIALQNLIAKYLAGPLAHSLSSAQRARAEAQAREDVDQAIAEYCAGRPDREQMALCTTSR